MNWLDSAISFISPKLGAKRAAWRNYADELRNYDAGNYGRLNAGWRATNNSAEITDRMSRETVRARARDLERNSDIMNSVILSYKRNVVGHGYQIQAATTNSSLNKQLEELWIQWCKPRNCDVTGTQSMNDILRMIVRRKKVDGGILILKRYTKDGMIPFKLQALEVDELDNMQTGPNEKGNRVVGGIEYNRHNRPVGYWIRQYQIDGYTIAEPVYIPAKDMIFIFEKRRPSQIREMSDMACTVPRVRDTNEFMTAVSVKERIAACLSVFIKKQLPPVGMGRSGSNSGNAGQKEYDGKTLTPGMIKELNAGDEVQVVNPTGQATDAASFTKLHQRMIGAGQGLSYEATSRDMSETNYASARQGAIEDELTYAEEEERLMTALDEIYETFVISCVLAGLVQIKDFWLKKDKYLKHEWIKQPKKWIDPLKESSATKTAMQTGQKTFKQIAAESGRDWRRQVDDMAEVLEYGRKKGIDLEGVIFNAKGKEKDPKKEDAAGQEPTSSEGGGGDTTAGGSEAAKE